MCLCVVHMSLIIFWPVLQWRKWCWLEENDWVWGDLRRGHLEGSSGGLATRNSQCPPTDVCVPHEESEEQCGNAQYTYNMPVGPSHIALWCGHTQMVLPAVWPLLVWCDMYSNDYICTCTHSWQIKFQSKCVNWTCLCIIRGITTEVESEFGTQTVSHVTPLYGRPCYGRLSSGTIYITSFLSSCFIFFTSLLSPLPFLSVSPLSTSSLPLPLSTSPLPSLC